MSKLGMFQGGTGVGSPVNVRLLSSVGDGVARAGAQMGSAVNSMADTALKTAGYFVKEKIEEDKLQDGLNADTGLAVTKAGLQGLRDRWNSDDFAGGSRETQADTEEFFSSLERPEFRGEREAMIYDNTIQNIRIASMADAKSIGEAATARRYKESARRMVNDAARAGEYGSAIGRISADEGVAWSAEEADELRGIVHDQQGWDVFNRTSKEDPWKGAALIGELAKQGNLSKKTLAKMAGYAEKNIKAAQSGLADALGRNQLLGEDVTGAVRDALKRGRITTTKARVLLGAAARGTAENEVHDGAVYGGLVAAVDSLKNEGVESDPNGEQAARIEFSINTSPISKGSKTYLLGELSALRKGDSGVGGERESASRKLIDMQFNAGSFGTIKDDDDTITPAGYVQAMGKKLAVEKEVQRLIRAKNVPLEDVPKLTNEAIRNVDTGKNIFSKADKGKDVIPPPSMKRDRIGADDVDQKVNPKKIKVDKEGGKSDALGVDVSIAKIDGEGLEEFVGRNWGAFGVETMEDAAMVRSELINLFYAG